MSKYLQGYAGKLHKCSKKELHNFTVLLGYIVKVTTAGSVQQPENSLKLSAQFVAESSDTHPLKPSAHKGCQ